jgi:adenine-specific DNA-methyltransferase
VRCTRLNGTLGSLRKVRTINNRGGTSVLQEGSAGSIDLSDFPSTRYQGSKRKIVPWLWTNFQELDFDSALDVFGGTGSVSYLLKKMGKEVTYNDYLQFNHLIGTALIENDEINLTQDDINAALLPIPDASCRFVSDVFQGVYFTDEENEWIDSVVAHIGALRAETPELLYKKALLYYALFQSCLIKRPFNLFHRRNLYLRLANVERAFGNKSSWEQSFTQRFRAFCAEVNGAVFKCARPCRAMRYSALDIPQRSYDLVYVDPPYLAKRSHNETSDYRRCYHFLEGLCAYERWGSLIDYRSTNLRLKELSPNVWTDRSKHAHALDSLIEKFDKSIIVLSYKKFGVPSIDTLIRMLKRHGKRVRSHSRHYKYALNHQNGMAAMNREVLLIAE